MTIRFSEKIDVMIKKIDREQEKKIELQNFAIDQQITDRVNELDLKLQDNLNTQVSLLRENMLMLNQNIQEEEKLVDLRV